MTTPPDPHARRGLMLVLSSPSGAGKSTIARRLRQAHPDLMLSVSVTTRKRRGSEVDGQDYLFLERDDFERKRDAGDLLEWAEVHGNLYATPKRPVQQAMAAGRDMLFDIDWQGAQQMQAVPEVADDVVSIFILPPSMAELQSRLRRRAEDSEETIARRLANARAEIEHWDEYSYVLINDDLERCFHKVEAILVAERERRTRRIEALEPFVAALVAEEV